MWRDCLLCCASTSSLITLQHHCVYFQFYHVVRNLLHLNPDPQLTPSHCSDIWHVFCSLQNHAVEDADLQRVVRDWLMEQASFSLSPTAPLLLLRSLPAGTPWT